MQWTYSPAMVVPLPLPSTYDDQDEMHFVHNIGDIHAAHSLGATVRDIPSDNDYWVIHVVAAYEYTQSSDYDPNGEVLSETGLAAGTDQDGPIFIFLRRSGTSRRT